MPREDIPEDPTARALRMVREEWTADVRRELADARAQSEALAETLEDLLAPEGSRESLRPEQVDARAALRAFRSSQESSDAR